MVVKKQKNLDSKIGSNIFLPSMKDFFVSLHAAMSFWDIFLIYVIPKMTQLGHYYPFICSVNPSGKLAESLAHQTRCLAAFHLSLRFEFKFYQGSTFTFLIVLNINLFFKVCFYNWTPFLVPIFLLTRTVLDCKLNWLNAKEIAFYSSKSIFLVR